MCLKKMDSKINSMGKQLEKVDYLEKKVTEVDGDVKKLLTFVHDQLKDNKDAISTINEKLDTFEFAIGSAQDEITQLNNDKKKMKCRIHYYIYSPSL